MIYEYYCPACEKTKEVSQGMNDPNIICDCGNEMFRVIQPVNVVFKCPGFPTHDSKVRMVDGIVDRKTGEYKKINY